MTTATPLDQVARWNESDGLGARGTLVLLSGRGERLSVYQRFGHRLAVDEPELLLADEPFGSLDALTRIKMHGLLKELCERHQPAVLLVTHDVDEAITLADRILLLEDGKIDGDHTVDLPAPRSPRDPRFQEYRDLLHIALGVSLGSHQS